MQLDKHLSRVYQSPRLDALHLHTLYIRVGRMNQYKEEWMHQTMMLPMQAMSSVIDEMDQSQRKLDQNYKLAKAINRTARAAFVGAAISAIDGPLPVMDIVGLGVASTMAAIAWHDYFS